MRVFVNTQTEVAVCCLLRATLLGLWRCYLWLLRTRPLPVAVLWEVGKVVAKMEHLGPRISLR